jgi:hypothetical protein
MNAFSNYYSPMNAFFGGFQMGDQMDQAAIREAERVRALKERDALAQMGQGNQFAGFEGVEGATRPDYLKQLYRDNPEAAWKVEQAAAQPFAVDRDISKQGKIERAKREADAEVGTNMMNAYFKARGGGQPDVQEASAIPASMTEGEAGQTGGAMPAPNLSRLSGDEPSFEMTPQGFKFGVKSASELDNAVKMHDMKLKDSELALKKEDLSLKKEDQILNKARFNEELGKNEQDHLNKLHQQSLSITQQMRELEKANNTGEMKPQVFLQQMNELMQQKKDIHAQKDVILRGQKQSSDIAGMTTDQYRNPSSTEPQAVKPKTSGALTKPKPQPPMTAREATPSPQVGSGLPYKMQVENNQKADQEKRKIATDAIESAHSEAAKAATHASAIDRMMGLLSKEDIGNRFVGNLPWGEQVLNMTSQNNDDLSRLRNQMIDLYKKEGETKSFDTLPELKIVASMIPDVTASPDTNRRNMVDVRNLFEARTAAPQFLEQWAQQHGGTIDGARQEFRSWMQHNPKYHAKDVHGRVQIQENAGFVPLPVWSRLRQRFSEADIMKKRDSGGLQIIGDKVFLKE